ncbi:MAG TPA: 4-hydroxyphenylacetate 3-hydroxylase, partial [Firmicutes bacterium]|nr:4-hydroxyphenylacetate 3-hydroxylase [Bacillota bacterium]
KTREEYLASLRAMRPNVWKFGELIEDVTTHPATRATVESHARAFDASHDPELAGIFTTTSSLTGEKIHRWNSLMRTMEDVLMNSKLKRASYQRTGTCTGGTCAGWLAQSVMWAITHDIDAECGTNYQERLQNWVLRAQEEGWIMSGALTDPKGNRALKPSQQPDPDSNLHVVEVRDDGIVVRGAKAMICGTAASNAIFVLPGSAYKEEDADYAVSFGIKRDHPNVRIIETRHPSDRREYEEGFDTLKTGITQAYIIFEDAFIPMEQVFMCREFKFTGKVIQYFTANYRANIGACVAGQGDVMIGAGVLMARANGLSSKVFMNKLIDMAVNNETTYGLGLGAIVAGKQHPAGIWTADSMLAHTNKVHVATLPYETKRICQDIGGGIVETGCFPSYQDFVCEEHGHLVQKYVKAGDVSAETRARAARLTEWLTLGAGVPGCMHGGGSPDGARLVVRAMTPFEKYAEYAKNLAGIEEEVLDPVKK